jgi:hypothetical protein
MLNSAPERTLQASGQGNVIGASTAAYPDTPYLHLLRVGRRAAPKRRHKNGDVKEEIENE